MDIEDAKVNLRKMLFRTKVANECGLSNHDFDEDIKTFETILAELDNQEKIINAMAKECVSFKMCEEVRHKGKCAPKEKPCFECIKQYYEKKVSENDAEN